MMSAVLATALSAQLSAQSAAQTGPTVNQQDLLRYDKNKNGMLDPDELSAMETDRAKATAAVSTAGRGQPDAGDVITMSPFEVSGAGDKGYHAANTLSGTRLNSKLEDLGSSITVVTKQQIQDLALQDINDIFLYEASTEGTGNYTAFEINRDGAVIDNVAGNPNNANRVRGIAAANQSRGNFGMSGRVPLDPIDMESVEISRGPNSGIFGLGNASGTVNVNPSQARLQKESTHIETRFDNYGSMRGAIDINRPLVKDKIAIRASAVFQQDEFQRKPSVARSKRYNGMITYHPFKDTTIRGSVQYYESFDRRPNAILPRDGISYWAQSGRPTWNAATATVTRNGVNTVVPYNNNQGTETSLLGPGLESAGNNLYARPSIYINPDGSVGLWMVGRKNTTEPVAGPIFGVPTPNRQAGNERIVESAPPPKEGPLWATAPSITDRSIYDWSELNLAAPNWRQTRNRNFNVEWEQFFINTKMHLLGMQLGWNREEGTTYNRNFIGQGGNAPMIVYIDVNQVLPDGSNNPYFLKPYLTAMEPTATRNPMTRDTFRGQLAYMLTMSREKNFLKWFGDHTLAGYGEYKNFTTAGYGYRDAIIDDHPWIPPGDPRASGITANRGLYRYYIGDTTGENIDTHPPDWRGLSGTLPLRWYNSVTGQWVNENATIGEAYQGDTRVNRNVIKTVGVNLQSHFVKDRLVTTFGIRKDENFNRRSTPATVAADGIHENLTNRTWAEDWAKRVGRTKTSGAVIKPFRGWTKLNAMADRPGVMGFLADALQSVDAYYNKSDSFLPSTQAHNLMGDVLPDPGGTGKDYGVMLTFFKGKLFVRLNKYDNVQTKSRFGDSGTIAARASRLDFSNTTGGTDRFNLYRNELSWVQNANPTFTQAQVATEVARQMGLPEDFLAKQNEMPISDTSDVTSRGKEIEVALTFNRYFRGRMNVTQQETIDNHLSPAIIQYINMRMPVWQKIVDPNTRAAGPDGVLNTTDDTFQPWWTTKYGGTSPQDFYEGSVLGPYKLAVANEGRTKSQIRKYRVNAFGSLDLGAFSDNRIIQRFTVTGAARWEDKASIGYYTKVDDPNSYDGNRPIYDKARMYFDAGLRYRQRVFRNRIMMTLQVNGRNITEDGRIQAVGALPNGQPHSYRIIDPRQVFFTASFDL